MEGRRGGGGCLFEAGRSLNFSAFRMGAYSWWALIRGWALILINTLIENSYFFPSFRDESSLFASQVEEKFKTHFC